MYQDNLQKILNKIGLSNQEARVYIALNTLKETKTGYLCEYTNIASSNIYKILNSLIKKGLVSFRVQNNIKIYMPSSPDALSELFLEKQKKLKEERKEIAKAIAQLKTKPVLDLPQSNYKYYEGLSGIKAMWYEINNLINNKHLMKIYTGKKGTYETLVGFYTTHHKIRKKKKIKEQLIFPKEEIKLAKKRKDKLTKIKFMQLENEAEWGVWNNIFYINYYPINKKPYGFLIKDPVYAKMFEQVFDQLWTIAKK